jgi:hypothetical protein
MVSCTYNYNSKTILYHTVSHPESGFATGRRRGVAATESKRSGVICNCSCRSPHLRDHGTEEQTVDLTNKDMTNHAATGGCMKVQTYGHTWEGVC